MAKFGVLGSVGDFIGGSLNSIFALITLIVVVIEAKKSERRENTRSIKEAEIQESIVEREQFKSTIEYLKTTLDFFFKRVSFAENQLKAFKYSGVDGLQAIKVFNKDNGVNLVAEEDLSNYLRSLNDLISESFFNKALIASSTGLNSQIAGIHSSKPTLIYPLLSSRYCSEYWNFIKFKATNFAFMSEITWFVAFYIHLKNSSPKSCYDFIDEDFIAIQNIQRTLSLNKANIFNEVTILSNGKL